jgi:LacI family transcriptional regulator
VLQGVREAASDFGHDILLHTDRCDEDVRRALSRMLGGLVDGVVIVPVKHDLMAEGLAASHLPTIAMGNPYPGLPCVHADSAYGMRLVVEHVLQKGHRSIAYFGRQGVPLAADEERVGVVRKVLAEAGIPLGEDRIIPLTDPGQIPLEAFWAMRPRPTAVVCFNDYRAGLLLEECRKQGIRVPEDLAIAGFDGAPEAPGGRQITTFTVDNEGIYRKTIELLIELIEGKAVPADTVVKGRFTEGNTT